VVNIVSSDRRAHNAQGKHNANGGKDMEKPTDQVVYPSLTSTASCRQCKKGVSFRSYSITVAAPEVEPRPGSA
jgi:hypothetical protein